MGNVSKRYVLKKAVFETTLACNLRCKHCGSKAGQPRADELSSDEIKNLMASLASCGCERVTLSGGEPTMRPDWIEVIGHVHKAGMRVGMFTNALRFYERDAKRARDRGLESIAFSVDGVGEVHDIVRGKVGHFEIIKRAMQFSRMSQLPFSVVTHINRLNIGQLPAICRFVAEQGAHAWQVQLGTDMGNMKDNRELLVKPESLIGLEEEIAKLVKSKPRNMRIIVSDSVGYNGPNEHVLRNPRRGRSWGGCRAGMDVVGIESNGNVKGCLAIMAGYNDEGGAFVEGNVRKKSFAEIWNSEAAFSYNRRWTADSLGGFCGDCRHAPRCRGGCRVKMVASGGGVDNPMCVYRACVERNSNGNYRGGTVAAALLASFVSAGVASGCGSIDDSNSYADAAYDCPYLDASDSESNNHDTETDYSYPEIDAGGTETDYMDPYYDAGDSETDTLDTDTD